MKKLLSIFIAFSLLFGTCQIAFAAEDVLTEGDYKYIVLEDGTIEITEYTGKEETVTIPSELGGKNVTRLGESAFKAGIYIHNLVISDGITSIDDYALEACSNLETVVMPDSLTEIGRCAFSGCANLKTVDFSENLETIGDGAFLSCRNLTSVVLPASLTSAGMFAFAECISLSDVSLNSGLTTISDRLFYGCTALSRIEIPSSIVTIGTRAFASSGLQTVSIPSSVTSVGEYAFANCGELTAADFPCSELAAGTFSNTFPSPDPEVPNNNELNFTGTLNSIGREALSGSNLSTVVIPQSVTSIDGSAFNRCNTSAYAVEEGNSAFTAVDGILYNSDMTELVAYPNKKETDTLVIPESVTKIGDYAFSTADISGEIILPSATLEIGDYSFADTNAPITLNEGLQRIGDYAFSGYGYGLETLLLPSSLEELGVGAFCRTNLERLTLPANVTEITDCMFRESYLHSITLSDSVSKIDPTAFAECNELSEINISENSAYFTNIDGVIFTKDRTELVLCPPFVSADPYIVPEGTRSIGDRAFLGNRSVCELYIPSSLTEMGDAAFGFYYEYRNTTFLRQKMTSSALAIYGSADSPVREYALKNNIAFFTGDPSQNAEDITLAGGETFAFSILNAVTDDVSFTSSDDRIASVDQNGVVTGLKTGTTSVIANVGLYNFKLNVEVTSDSSIAYTGFDDSSYRQLTKDAIRQWAIDYNTYNNVPDGFPNYYIDLYKGQAYYESMKGVQDESSYYYTIGTDSFGSDYKEMMLAMNHGVAAELARYRQPENVVLYSGVSTLYTTQLTGTDPSIKSLKNAVGTTYTDPFFMSTSLSEMVSQNFASSDGVVYIVYADKEALNNCPAGYADSYTTDVGEYEILLDGNAKFEVLDAGVREVYMESFSTDEAETRLERYVKLKLINEGGSPDQPVTPDKPVTPDEPETPDKPVNPEKPDDNPSKSSDKVKTADPTQTSTIIILGFFMIASVGTVAVTRYRKKNKYIS